MGQVIRFDDYQTDPTTAVPQGHDSLIPVELALGVEDEQDCLATIARFGDCPVCPRLLSDGSGSVIYLVSVSDAIRLNRRILESSELDIIEQGCCVDLIQMLENVSETIVQEAWGIDDDLQSQSS